MGGLTIYMKDETFLQVKPTLTSGLMGSILLGGLATGRSFLQPLMGSAFDLDDDGWKKLTLRWGLFFLLVAALNEVARHTLSFSVWVAFKTFGVIGLTFAFLIFQLPLLQRHAQGGQGDSSPPDDTHASD